MSSGPDADGASRGKRLRTQRHEKITLNEQTCVVTYGRALAALARTRATVREWRAGSGPGRLKRRRCCGECVWRRGSVEDNLKLFRAGSDREAGRGKIFVSTIVAGSRTEPTCAKVLVLTYRHSPQDFDCPFPPRRPQSLSCQRFRIKLALNPKQNKFPQSDTSLICSNVARAVQSSRCT